jgi:hypothetical protein
MSVADDDRLADERREYLIPAEENVPSPAEVEESEVDEALEEQPAPSETAADEVSYRTFAIDPKTVSDCCTVYHIEYCFYRVYNLCACLPL